MVEFIGSSPDWIQVLQRPWHWSLSGIAIAMILFLMTWMGRSFGVSSAFRGFCTLAGAGKRFAFFDLDLSNEYWRFAFILGAVVGGFFASQFLTSPEAVAISEATIAHLQDWGINYPQGNGLLPEKLIHFGNLKGVLIAITGGFLVGFGARYGGGCTSGHAITGLSHLQIPSLITVIGFFIGGLIMTWGIMPFIFG